MLCKRCSATEACVVVRTEHLCKECFQKYVNTKVVKRLEAYRVRNAEKDRERIILLPISLGVSSLALLHILNRQYEHQLDFSHRTGFQLHILFISDWTGGDDSLSADHMRTIKEAYPRHTYSALALADAFNSAYALSKSPEDDGLPLTELNGDSSLSCQERLERYISALPSATSKHDLVGILRTRLIVAFGKKHGCESVAWGDSTTRLAEKMLAETAKGRGFALPWHVSDGMTPYGLTFTYPLRDLLKKEIIMYSSMTNPLSSIVTEDPRAMQPAASAKDTTIDQLMSQYFESVEENYPAIVANVVRTSSKLEAPRLPEQLITCTLCSMPIADGITGIHGWGGDQEALPPNAQPALVHGVSERLCYGCARSVKG